jgi:hypothetical protein
VMIPNRMCYPGPCARPAGADAPVRP